jgi:hypothetical protein
VSEQEAPANRRDEAILELIQVLVLAVVTIATAWSGYQAAKWGGSQASLYGLASTTRFKADAASTLGGQQLVADSSIFTAWLQAHSDGNADLQKTLVKRFSPDYRAAFDAWLRTDPFTDPAAPAGPGYMPGFTNPNFDRARQLNATAAATFATGSEARETANKYLRDAVLFASVLLLLAIAQRLKIRQIQIGAMVLALGLLAYTVVDVAVLPRL